MLVGTKEVAKMLGMPVYSVMRMQKSGIIPAISLGHGRGSKLLFDPELVQDALRAKMIEDQQERRIYCAG